MSAETDAELAALRYADNARVLNDAANRDYLASQTALNLAASRFADQRSKVRVTLRRCAVFGCVLVAAWSAFAFTVVR